MFEKLSQIVNQTGRAGAILKVYGNFLYLTREILRTLLSRYFFINV